VPLQFADLFTPFPTEYTTTADGDNFLLLKDYVSENSSLALVIFMSPFGRQLLQSSKFWLADGTFWTAPPPFVQIYMINALASTGRVLPVCYCLLPNKETDTYTRMWESIKFSLSDNGQFTPDVLKVDFELAAINSFKNSFPTSKVTHFKIKSFMLAHLSKSEVSICINIQLKKYVP
jgi:hypothetical protein